jgi:hypothetical protein
MECADWLLSLGEVCQGTTLFTRGAGGAAAEAAGVFSAGARRHRLQNQVAEYDPATGSPRNVLAKMECVAQWRAGAKRTPPDGRASGSTLSNTPRDPREVPKGGARNPVCNLPHAEFAKATDGFSELNLLSTAGASCAVFSGQLFGFFVAVKALRNPAAPAAAAAGSESAQFLAQQFSSEMDVLCKVGSGRVMGQDAVPFAAARWIGPDCQPPR